ncbi:MAG: carboxypeptidase-like regulatory domain-containing protein [Tannerella sp.]|nr:carboxypeptidase-like regulatory domain-containing protein [Tannerella sp.]
MKLSAVLLFLCIFVSYAADIHSQNARININENHLTIGKFIHLVEEQTDYLFVYSQNELNTNEPLSVQSGYKPVVQYLNEVFGKSEIKYTFENDYIVLTKRNSLTTVTGQQQQQGRQITGVVTDTNGEPIVGANVIEKGSRNGTVTDIDGNFALNVPDNAVLQVSYIGYITQEINAPPALCGGGG